MGEGIHKIFFLHSPRKHMLWVLIRSASAWRNKKTVNNFWLKKVYYLELRPKIRFFFFFLKILFFFLTKKYKYCI